MITPVPFPAEPTPSSGSEDCNCTAVETNVDKSPQEVETAV